MRRLPLVDISLLFAMIGCCASANAQSGVTLFGIADAGIEFNNNAGRNGDSLVRLVSGNQSGSRWGLRGAEDLGSGLKAVFLLESGFDIDTGNSGQGGRLFGRNAYVGLDSQYGSLLLGRQQTGMREFGNIYDPNAIADRYSILSIAPEFGARADNAIKYVGKFGKLTGQAFYSFQANGSEVAGSNVFGRNFGAFVNYNSGSLALGVAYDDAHVGTPSNQAPVLRRVSVAGTYAVGDAKAYAGYRLAKAYDGAMLPGAQAANAGSNLYWLGLAYKVTPAFSLTGAAYYQDFRQTGSDPWQFVLTSDYSLSKRTDLYASVSYALNTDNSALGVNGFNSGSGTSAVLNVQPGKDQVGAVMGLRHRF
ncbi:MULTISPECIES: porin [unclassified Cupriavidus]|uniref:porin n=2 Tax=Cupriavidus TaxID=106589 RepID=UPI0006872F19|nr:MULTISPECIES: porin [unclassified Cupriavidus]MBP0630837.1 porin [Cupriavidus sp. AcVe19-1a]MBP0639851.1 porin [Cupriavidus sp. AcVe19-6a]